MAFRFSLETVLRLRRRQEHAERLKLEAIISEQNKARACLDGLIQSSIESRRSFRNELAVAHPASELQFQAALQSNAETVVTALQDHMLQLEQNRIAQLQIFYKSRQRREILENLRERNFEAYNLEMSRREQQELDDMFLMRQETIQIKL